MRAVEAGESGGGSSSSKYRAGEVSAEAEMADDVMEEGEIRGTGDDPAKVDPYAGERKVKDLVDPRRPSQAEVEAHERANHGTYRNWCAVCVRARGKDLDHRADAGEERGLSEYSFDYCFPGDEFGFKVTTLVGRERKTGCMMATAVPVKGSTGRFAADKILEFMEEVGDRAATVLVKTDQEPAITGLIEDVVSTCTMATVHVPWPCYM